jgi:uncharacterized protein YecE (DUF72 family)
MEFGKVTAEDLEFVNFSLPADGTFTRATLSGITGAEKARFYVGCGKWGRDEWKGLIYPEDTKPANFLDEYAKQFNSIELNASFYNIPTVKAVESWKTKVTENASPGFKFVPKFPKSITHFKKLKGAEEPTELFVKNLAGLGDYLGPCFLQLSDTFAPKDFGVLEAYLKSLPKEIQVFVELRNRAWFAELDIRKRLFELLAELKMGAVLTDTNGRRDLLHMELTVTEAFIRFEGNGSKMLSLDEKRIQEWAVRLKSWLENGLTTVYFFLHQEDEADTPALADVTVKTFNRELGAGLPSLTFISN